MMLKSILATGLICGMCLGTASAETTGAAATDTTASGMPARNPVLGDPGARNATPGRTMRSRRSARAAAITRGDKQPPGTENGNQPDRAGAGGGGG